MTSVWGMSDELFSKLLFAGVNETFFGPAEHQPPEAPTTGEDPPVELQRSFFEVPGFMQPPQSGGQ